MTDPVLLEPPVAVSARLPSAAVGNELGHALTTMRWGFPHSVPGKRIDKATGKPVMLEKRVTNVRNYIMTLMLDRQAGKVSLKSLLGSCGIVA